MTSCVFVKFMSQKEPRRIEFDGTGISVFELKRDIIVKNGLDRSGTDFDLALYTEDGSEEYDDDTSVISRSTTVLARRLPAVRPGAGRAARYVSGRMPVTAKNHSRREQTTKTASSAKSQSDLAAKMASAQTEEEKMMAMFAVQGEQWKTQQEEMSHQTPVFRPGQKKPTNVPDHEPPNGYICHRCGEKGHWIQQCPTNDNPEYNDRPRIKRTTGIPKSFLKTVDKATVLAQAGDDDGTKPSGVMVTADGEFVVAEPDKKTWDKYKAKAQSSEEAKKLAAQGEKELQDRGIECELDKKMFIDPMKTPCCAKTYCNDCITNALIEGDLVCPSCQTEGVLIDDLKPDDEATQRIDEYLKEKDAAKKESSESPEDAKSPSTAPTTGIISEIKEESNNDKTDGVVKAEASNSPSPSVSKNSPTAASSQKAASPGDTVQSDATPPPNTKNDAGNAKKRPAEDDLENPVAKAPKAPKAMQRAHQQQQQHQHQQQMGMTPDFMNMNPGMMNGFGGMNGFNPMAMNPMLNPMMMNGGFPPNNMNGGGSGFHHNLPMNGNGFNNGPQMNGGGNNLNRGPPTGPRHGVNNNTNSKYYMGNPNTNNNHNNNANANANANPNTNIMNNMAVNGGGGGNGIEDDAYFRKPVNPHRHQNKQRRVRPSDYREL